MADGVGAQSCAEVTKYCPGCSTHKPTSAFGPRKQSKDGLRPRCNICRQVYQSAKWRKNLAENRAEAAQRRRDKYRENPEKYRAETAKWRAANPRPKTPRVLLSDEERSRRKTESRKRTYEKNKVKVLAQAAQYRAEHKEEERRNRAAHYQKNKDRVAEVTKAYRLANRDLYRAAGARRRAAKLQATPPWADLAAIAEFYSEAARLTTETGILHEVDHIYPLQGKDVCGLHVPGNLQIITRAENRSKSNKLVA